MAQHLTIRNNLVVFSANMTALLYWCVNLGPPSIDISLSYLLHKPGVSSLLTLPVECLSWDVDFLGVEVSVSWNPE